MILLSEAVIRGALLKNVFLKNLENSVAQSLQLY